MDAAVDRFTDKTDMGKSGEFKIRAAHSFTVREVDGRSGEQGDKGPEDKSYAIQTCEAICQLKQPALPYQESVW